MKHGINEIDSLPTRKQVESERKRYRRQKAYNKALGGTVYVLTIVAAFIVNFIFYFKLDKINMAEALKSVE